MQTQKEQDCLQINTRVIKLVKIGKIRLKLEKERQREPFLKIALDTTQELVPTDRPLLYLFKPRRGQATMQGTK